MQAKTYRILQEYLSKRHGFVFSCDYGNYIALSNTMSKNDHIELKNIIEKEIGLKTRIASIVHPHPLTAQLIASRILLESSRDFYYDEKDEDEIVLMIIRLRKHDMLGHGTSVFEKFTDLMIQYASLLNIIQSYGGIAGYLGRSDVLAVLPLNSYREFTKVLPEYYNVGVGIALNARKALALAKKALKDSLSVKHEKRIVVYSDDKVLE